MIIIKIILLLLINCYRSEEIGMDIEENLKLYSFENKDFLVNCFYYWPKEYDLIIYYLGESPIESSLKYLLLGMGPYIIDIDNFLDITNINDNFYNLKLNKDFPSNVVLINIDLIRGAGFNTNKSDQPFTSNMIVKDLIDIINDFKKWVVKDDKKLKEIIITNSYVGNILTNYYDLLISSINGLISLKIIINNAIYQNNMNLSINNLEKKFIDIDTLKLNNLENLPYNKFKLELMDYIYNNLKNNVFLYNKSGLDIENENKKIYNYLNKGFDYFINDCDFCAGKFLFMSKTMTNYNVTSDFYLKDLVHPLKINSNIFLNIGDDWIFKDLYTFDLFYDLGHFENQINIFKDSGYFLFYKNISYYYNKSFYKLFYKNN